MPVTQSGSSDDLLDITSGKAAKVAFFSASGVELLDEDGRLPVTPEPRSRGIYTLALRSGALAATLADGAPFLALVWAGTRRFQLRQIRVSALVAATITTAVFWGLELFVATAVEVNDSGGLAIDFATGEARKRTSHPVSGLDGTASAAGGLAELRYANGTVALTAGTRTLKTYPVGSWRGHTGTVVGTKVFSEPQAAESFTFATLDAPIELVDGEGLYLKGSGAGPATGALEISLLLSWAELEA